MTKAMTCVVMFIKNRYVRHSLLKLVYFDRHASEQRAAVSMVNFHTDEVWHDI